MAAARPLKLSPLIALLALAISPVAHALDDLDVTIRVIDRLDRNAEAFINRIELPAQSIAGAAAMSPRQEDRDRGNADQRSNRQDPAVDAGRDHARERGIDNDPTAGERRDTIAETAREAGERRREAIEDARQQRREALEEMRESRSQRGH